MFYFPAKKVLVGNALHLRWLSLHQVEGLTPLLMCSEISWLQKIHPRAHWVSRKRKFPHEPTVFFRRVKISPEKECGCYYNNTVAVWGFNTCVRVVYTLSTLHQTWVPRSSPFFLALPAQSSGHVVTGKPCGVFVSRSAPKVQSSSKTSSTFR